MCVFFNGSLCKPVRGKNAMKILMTVFIVLVPGFVVAATNCHMAEYPDHYEAVCIGDEKAIPEPYQKPAPTQNQPAPASTFTNQAAVTSPVMEQANTTIKLSGPVRHQGRQQFQQALKEARDSRARLLAEQEQAQPHRPAPSPLSTMPAD